MPIQFIEEDRFVQRWDPKQDIILLVIAHHYRSPRGHIQWKKARADGYLDEFPETLSNKDLSRRIHHLLYQKYNKEWRTLKREEQKKNPPKPNSNSYKKRLEIFKGLPEEVRKKHGYRTKQVWDQEQQETLIWMAEEYRVSKNKIDWQALMKDERVQSFPYQKLARVRSYYWRVITLASNPEALTKKRAGSLQWKKANMKKYRENQKRRQGLIREMVNEHING